MATYAAHPHPELSLTWQDGFWPPEAWYTLTSQAIEKVGNLWRFDEPETVAALLPKLTEEQHLLWAVENIVGQICNGGFSQALYNSYGELAEEAVCGLRTFGLTRHAEIVDMAWTIFGDRPISKSRKARITKLEAMSDGDEEATEEQTIEHAFALFRATSANWTDLADEFFGLLHAKTHGEGYNAAYYRPLAEWVYENKDRFFVT